MLHPFYYYLLVLLSTVAAVFTQTIVRNQCEGKEGTSEYASNTYFTFYTNKSAIGDGTLTLSLKGYYVGSLAYAVVFTEDDDNIIMLPEDGERVHLAARASQLQRQ